MAWVMSKAPAIRPPTAIAKSAFLFPNCMIWSFEDGHYIGARLTRKRKNISGNAAKIRSQRSDVRRNEELPCRAVVRQPPDEGGKPPRPFRRGKLDAFSSGVRPFELNVVAGDFLEFPGADVANLSVGVVVPARTGNGVGDSLAQLMGTGAGKRIERVQTTETTCATRVRHYPVKNIPGVVVIAAIAPARTT